MKCTQRLYFSDHPLVNTLLAFLVLPLLLGLFTIWFIAVVIMLLYEISRQLWSKASTGAWSKPVISLVRTRRLPSTMKTGVHVTSPSYKHPSRR